MTKIVARVLKDGTVVRELAFEMMMPATLTEASTMWGDTVALNLLLDSVTIAAQGHMRSLGNPDRKSGRLSDSEVAKKMADWRPIGRQTDPAKKVETLKKGLNSLSDVDRAELLAALGIKVPVSKPGIVKAAKK